MKIAQTTVERKGRPVFSSNKILFISSKLAHIPSAKLILLLQNGSLNHKHNPPPNIPKTHAHFVHVVYYTKKLNEHGVMRARSFGHTPHSPLTMRSANLDSSRCTTKSRRHGVKYVFLQGACGGRSMAKLVLFQLIPQCRTGLWLYNAVCCGVGRSGCTQLYLYSSFNKKTLCSFSEECKYLYICYIS